jgi:hypothetical protein
MRIISKSRNHFRGTHKGHTVEIEREGPSRFYIRVYSGFGYAYDGYAPADITTMVAAKREALRGHACEPLASCRRR